MGKIWRCSCWEKGNFIMINEIKYDQTWKIWPSSLSLSFYSTFKAYSEPYVTLAYSQSCYSLSYGIFRIRGLLKTLWNIDQAYSELCHRKVFSHIQAYSEPYQKHIQKPGILRILEYLKPFHNCILVHIYKNFQIFRTLKHLKSDAYSEPSQIIKMEFF